jgi:hypothetical protein
MRKSLILPDVDRLSHELRPLILAFVNQTMLIEDYT